MAPEDSPGRGENWWPAPAKLNLFLHVTGRRSDGFHQLQTLFQLLDWGDEVFLEASEDGKIQRRAANYDVAEDEDLAVRAASALQAESGVSAGAVIEVNKRIPPGAGLGGGSSDAATVLVALNQIWNCGLGVESLARIGLGLGADVPVFVRGRSALATGVGEQLEPVTLGVRHYLLVVPDIAISTAEIFSDPGLKRNSALIGAAEAIAGQGRNDCLAVACQRNPELLSVMEKLRQFGEPRMSGTGSAVFVRMASREAANEAADGAARIFNCRYNVRAVGGLDHSTLLRTLDSRTSGMQNPGSPPSS